MLYLFLPGRCFKIGKGNRYFPNLRGIPQGSGVGPLAFSAFINDIGNYISIPFLLYCDDIVIYASGTDLKLITESITHQLDNVNRWCSENCMEMNYSKTKFMIFSKTPTPPNIYTSLVSNGQQIERVDHFKYLGVIFEENLKFDSHFNTVKVRVQSQIKFLYGIKKYLTRFAVKVLLNAYVHSIIDYCVDIWAVQPAQKLSGVQEIINGFLVSYFVPKFAKQKRQRKYRSLVNSVDINSILRDLNLLTFKERSDLSLLKQAFFKIKEGKAQLLGTHERTFPRLLVPKHFSQTFKRSIAYRESTVWNLLPREWIFEGMSLGQFIKHVKVWLIEQRPTNSYFY